MKAFRESVTSQKDRGEVYHNLWAACISEIVLLEVKIQPILKTRCLEFQQICHTSDPCSSRSW